MHFAPNIALGQSKPFKRKKAISSSKGRFIRRSQSKVKARNLRGSSPNLLVPDPPVEKVDILTILTDKSFRQCCKSGNCFLKMFTKEDGFTDYDEASKFYFECNEKVRIMNADDKKTFAFHLFQNLWLMMITLTS